MASVPVRRFHLSSVSRKSCRLRYPITRTLVSVACTAVPALLARVLQDWDINLSWRGERLPEPCWWARSPESFIASGEPFRPLFLLHQSTSSPGRSGAGRETSAIDSRLPCLPFPAGPSGKTGRILKAGGKAIGGERGRSLRLSTGSPAPR